MPPLIPKPSGLMIPPSVPIVGTAIKRRMMEVYNGILVGVDAMFHLFYFTPPPDATEEEMSMHQANKVSVRMKTEAAESLGLDVKVTPLSPDTTLPELRERLEAVNEVGLAYVVQRPVPSHLAYALEGFDHHKANIDPTNDPVTAAAGIEVLESCLGKESSVAVVGANGFVGSKVADGMERRGHLVTRLDQGDDLMAASYADGILAATGKSGILTSVHTQGVEIVVSTSFIPTPHGVETDCTPEALLVARRHTPVPGGMGPFEMTKLMQRLGGRAGIDLRPPRYPHHMTSTPRSTKWAPQCDHRDSSYQESVGLSDFGGGRF